MELHKITTRVMGFHACITDSHHNLPTRTLFNGLQLTEPVLGPSPWLQRESHQPNCQFATAMTCSANVLHAVKMNARQAQLKISSSRR